MDNQLAYVLIAGLILIVNGFILFWLQSVKTDLRDLRQHYFDALKQVGRLEVEIANLRTVIADLRAEIVILKKSD